MEREKEYIWATQRTDYLVINFKIAKTDLLSFRKVKSKSPQELSSLTPATIGLLLFLFCLQEPSIPAL